MTAFLRNFTITDTCRLHAQKFHHARRRALVGHQQLMWMMHAYGDNRLRLAASHGNGRRLGSPAQIRCAQGGMGGAMATQANALCEIFARNLGGQHRLLHLPEGISAQAAEEIARIAQVREALELLRHADVLFYGIARAHELSHVRGLGALEREALDKTGAVGEALGFYFNSQGAVVSNRASLVLRAADIGRRMKAAAIAVGHSKAEAIISICMHHPHKLLVTDEGAALRMMELLRM